MGPDVINTIPVLPVRDIDQSIRFYTDTLEWKLDWRGGLIGSVSRDGHNIMLSQMIPVTDPVWAWIGLGDDSLFKLYQDRDVTILQEPQNWTWGYEMKIADLDGNVLWLATGTRTDLPLADG